ncbi:MAG: transposase [Acidimicrobiales bacterium]
MAEWLPEDHLAWFVLDTVSLVDTSAFHARYPKDGPGRPAWDPEMLLALLIYAYCQGLRSSRRIEAACRSDVAFRVICANRIPDHASIARFRADHEAAIEAAFVDVLSLCARAEMVSLGVIAIDGTKIAADAALDANRRASTIRAEVAAILAEAASSDATEGSELSLVGAPQLPEPFRRRDTRRARLEAALAEIEAQEDARAEKESERAEKAAAEAAEGRKLRGRKPSDPHAALARAEADLAATKNKAARQEEEQAKQSLAGAEEALDRARQAAEAAPGPEEARANTTDPQSRMMKTRTGFVQGYNAQAAVNERQIVLAAMVTQDANDVHQLVPMMDEAAAMVAAAGVAQAELGLVLADAGYWSEHNATAEGPDRLIATLKDWKQRKAARELGTTSRHRSVSEAPAPGILPPHPLHIAHSCAWSFDCAWRRVEPGGIVSPPILLSFALVPSVQPTAG